jgi:hypothetical protein
MLKIIFSFLVFFFLWSSLSGQELSPPLVKDTAILFKGKLRSALFFGTDIGEEVFLQHWKLFLKEKFNTTLKSDFKNKSSSFFLTKEILSPNDFGDLPTSLHVAFIPVEKDSLVWILFADTEVLTKKWQRIADAFLLDKLAVMYDMVFDVLKKDVHFLEKELDSYRNKLISNRKLISKLEKENFTLEGLIREEEDALRSMIQTLADKIKKWEKLKAVP